VRVDAGLRLRLENVLESPKALARIVHAERAAGVDHVAAVRAVVFHQLGLLGKSLLAVVAELFLE
jgi:hypothetical protein